MSGTRAWYYGAALSVAVWGCGGSEPSEPLAQAGSGAGRVSAGSGAASGGGSVAAGSVAPPAAGAAAPSAGVGGSRPSATGGAGAVAVAGAPAVAGRAGSAAVGGSGAAGSGGSQLDKFSFFVTSLEAMRELSGSENGFGGDLRFGEQTGLAGADKICSTIADMALPGASAKGWRAFLSTKAGGASGGAIHARDRIGEGPWYDRNGRVIAMNLTALLATRPAADNAIINDLPNERGEPNRGTTGVDNHDTITGSDAMGRYADSYTCEDWTSVETPMSSTGSSGGRPGGGRGGGPMCGHSWPAMSGMSWIQAHPVPGCSPSVSLMQNGAGSGTGIGNGGGYGGIYCFALTP